MHWPYKISRHFLLKIVPFFIFLPHFNILKPSVFLLIFIPRFGDKVDPAIVPRLFFSIFFEMGGMLIYFVVKRLFPEF